MSKTGLDVRDAGRHGRLEWVFAIVLETNEGVVPLTAVVVGVAGPVTDSPLALVVRLVGLVVAGSLLAGTGPRGKYRLREAGGRLKENHASANA